MTDLIAGDCRAATADSACRSPSELLNQPAATRMFSQESPWITRVGSATLVCGGLKQREGCLFFLQLAAGVYRTRVEMGEGVTSGRVILAR